MKTILVTATNSFFVKNFLRTEAHEILAHADGVRLVVLAPKEKRDYYRAEFPQRAVVFDLLPETKKTFTERLFRFVETSSIHTTTTVSQAKTEYKKSKGEVPLLFRVWIFLWRIIFWLLGQFYYWRVLLRALYLCLPSSFYADAFRKYSPALVYCPSMVFEEYVFLKESRRAGIKTAGMVLSWDNLTSKTILRVHPDTLLVHTDEIKRQAISFGDFPAERIRVVGIPQYDRYFRREGILPREEFLKSIGANHSKKLILYGFSGKAGLRADFEMLQLLYEMLGRRDIPHDVSVLVRPYPRYDLPPKELKKIRETYGFLAKPAMAHVGAGKTNWEFDAPSLSLLANSLAHADLIITMYSTFFIEGAIFDTPLIGIVFDAHPMPRWNSVTRFFPEWEHLRGLGACGGVTLVKSARELSEAIREYLKNPALLSDGRKKIIGRECQYTDGRSGRRLAELFLALLS